MEHQQQQQQQQQEEHANDRQARSFLHRLTSAASAAALSSAVSELRLLSKLNPDLRSPLADAGLVPILARLLLLRQDRDQEDEDHLAIEENAAATLLNLSISAPETLMSCPSLLPSLSSALRRRRSPPLNQLAAATLFSLLSVEPFRPIIGSKHALILSPLISLLRSPSPPTRTLKDALKALYAAALYPLNRPPLISLGAVPALFDIVAGDGRRGVVEDATAVVAQLAGCWESVDAFREAEGVRVLAGLVAEGSGRAAENAAAAMLNMVMSGGERAAEEVRPAEAAVRGLAERGGSERGRRKAAELVRAMERWWGPQPRRSSGDYGSPARYSDTSSLASSSEWSIMRFSSSADSSSF